MTVTIVGTMTIDAQEDLAKKQNELVSIVLTNDSGRYQ